MKRGDKFETFSKALSPDNNRTQQQQQEKEFHVVLINIQKAAEDKVISCVEKSLTGYEDLKFVALSYRWGELNETTIVTGLDYLATETSFNLEDFCWLCKVMKEETDLKHMDYVWVDAICVDQNNYERRKATIHQMTNIYKRANYILAVPDLHLEHLKMTTTKTNNIIKLSNNYGEYIYHILQDIRTLMVFLVDLIKDWSSRVWVISECNIANEKNRLKYWFLQLRYGYYSWKCITGDLNVPFLFFEFDFGQCALKNIEKIDFIKNARLLCEPMKLLTLDYHYFHSSMIQHLSQQSFLELILKSKASKPEDRFYAVLPSSQYSDIIAHKDAVTSWKIRTLISVKLKLYEFMTIKDKLTLLYLSGNYSSLGNDNALPTFATSNIFWPIKDNMITIGDVNYGGNFDLSNTSTIQLIPINKKSDINDDDGLMRYKLNIKPMEYYVCVDDEYQEEQFYPTYQETIRKRLELCDSNIPLDNVYIPNLSNRCILNSYNDDLGAITAKYIFLIGSFAKNKWALRKHLHPKIFELLRFSGDNTGFDIY